MFCFRSAEVFTPATTDETDLVEQFFAPKIGKNMYWLGYAMLELVVKETDIEVGDSTWFWGSIYSGAEMPEVWKNLIYAFNHNKGSPQETCLSKGIFRNKHISDVSCNGIGTHKTVTICTLGLEQK